jgi:ABC-type transport system substrate-binding protein
MFREGGNRVQQSPKDYQTDWLPNYYYGYLSKDYATGKVKGFNGFMYGAERTYPTVAGQLVATVHKDGERFHGATPDGRDPHLGDPKVNDLVDKIRVEFDLKKQQDLVQELIRYLAQKAYNIPATISNLNYALNWPVVGNAGLYRTYAAGNGPAETSLHWWIDDTQPPLKKA